jgi:hypothetical protein
MKQNTWSLLSLLIMVTVMVSSCEVIGGIFKAGVWTGTIIVVLILALVIWLISKFSSRNKN